MSIWTDKYLEALMSQLLEGRPKWLIERQHKALHRFLKDGFPDKNQPAWQYTSTKFIKEAEFKLSTPSIAFVKNVESIYKRTSDFYDVVFVNGHYFEKLSSISALKSQHVTISSLNNLFDAGEKHLKASLDIIDLLKIKDAPFHYLAKALLTDCVYINIPAGAQLDKPIRILHLTNNNFSFHMRHVWCFFQLEDNAKAVVFEEFKSSKAECCLNNYVTQIKLGKAATLNYYNAQFLIRKTAHIHQLIVLQAKASDYQHYDIAQGATFARNDRRIYLQEKKARATLKGVFSINENHHIDHYIHVDHGQSETTSDQLYKGLATDHSHAIFNSHVLIPKNVRKAIASQLSKNLLLSSDAEIDLKPALEIYSDDVQCSHGATIGALDEKALFYLRSRGIDREKAEQLLKQGFLTEVIETMPHSSCRKKVAHFFSKLTNIS